MIVRRLCALIGVLLVLGSAGVVRGQEDGLALILSPQAGQTLIGTITITGTAASPNFQRYKLEFSLQGTGEARWFPIAEVAQQVTAGPLAQWDTAAVPDGIYQLRLRVTLRNGAVLQTSVQNLIVNNKSATALPTVALPPTAALTETPALGPSPTAAIQQPPLLTPRPTFALLANPTAPAPASDVSLLSARAAANVAAIQASFCNGALIAFFGFGLFGAYRVLFSRVGARFRRWLGTLRGE